MEEAKRVTEAMETAHVTQAELAAVLGITQQAVFQQLKRGLTRECTGTTQRDGIGREEGGGFRMGNRCIPVADSF